MKQDSKAKHTGIKKKSQGNTSRQASAVLEEKKIHRRLFGGIWHVLVMVGYHRGWPEWHWVKEDEHLRSLDK